jgi:class 3 adenylate cyclase
MLGCVITTHVYPSAEYKSAFDTNEPVIYLLGVIGIFCLAAVVFFVYDHAVEVRQRQVMLKAEKSNAIVNSFFPTQVRDRLIDRNKGGRGGGEMFSGEVLARKNSILMSSLIRNGDRANLNLGTSKPIADLYPHTTIMFGDIANFTAWSSVREPTHVFTLLEAVYSTFDKIAKKRRVFKVETIGDCYVAAAGLPEPRRDHAVVMARFARDCMLEMQDIVVRLEVFLGPDTADLKIRMGLHSGPVTAGVLRGEKSRFQVFGDTVNTAARMESTGQKSKIQVSKDTAELLNEAGKAHWLQSRSELVEAKGKGQMQTYWLEFRKPGSGLSLDMSLHTTGADSLDEFFLEGLPTANVKHDRLVNWNVEILLRMLQKVVAMRKPSQGCKDSCDTDSSDNSNLSKPRNGKSPRLVTEEGMTVLDEVKEIIPFSNKTAKYRCDPASISLGPVVESQLRDYVKTVSYMYRSNPFHNFEHASHVTQSLTKFLSRVVTADTIDFQDMTYKRKAATHKLHKYSFGITSDPLIEFSCALSALIHDVDHPGVPNVRLVQEGADMAEVYKNKSVAEQNSVELAWGLLMEPKYHELRRVIYQTQSELNRFRQLVVNSVMATDIVDKELGQLRKKRWEKAFNTGSQQLLAPEAPSDSTNRKATIVIEHLIQAADVAHTMQHWHVFLKWNERLFRELYKAYLDGRSHTDPSVGWYNGELGFFDFYIIPLAKKLENCGVFGVSSDECLEYARANRTMAFLRGLLWTGQERRRRIDRSNSRLPVLLKIHYVQQIPSDLQPNSNSVPKAELERQAPAATMILPQTLSRSN